MQSLLLSSVVILVPHSSWQKFLINLQLLKRLHTRSCFAVSQHSARGKYLFVNLSKVSSIPIINIKGKIKKPKTITIKAGKNPLL
jgi:hypothetical protein